MSPSIARLNPLSVKDIDIRQEGDRWGFRVKWDNGSVGTCMAFHDPVSAMKAAILHVENFS